VAGGASERRQQLIGKVEEIIGYIPGDPKDRCLFALASDFFLSRIDLTLIKWARASG
jgi:hypothetical protein